MKKREGEPKSKRVNTLINDLKELQKFKKQKKEEDIEIKKEKRNKIVIFGCHLIIINWSSKLLRKELSRKYVL